MENPIDIFVWNKAFDDEFCNGVILGFERHFERIPSYVYNSSDPETRCGDVVFLRDIDNGDDYEKLFVDCCEKALSMFCASHPGLSSLSDEKRVWTNPRIEKVGIGGGFLWHMDSRQRGQDRRFLSVVCYLNNVDKGGEIEFLFHPCNIQPRAGRLLMFPPYWTHVHRGNPPISGPKYAIGNFAVIEELDHDGEFHALERAPLS